MASESIAKDRSANHDGEIIAGVVVFTILAVAAFLARVLTRVWKRIPLGLDDALLVIALLAAMAETVWIAVATQIAGMGHHLAGLGVEEIVKFEQMFFACGILQPTALAFTKISILLLLHQIFIPQAFRITCWVLGAIVVAWYLAVVFAASFICLPVSSVWDPSTPAHCGNQKVLQVVTPLPWIITDFAILIAPMPVLRRLHTSRRQKAGLMALFLIGGLTCICSCVRYSTIWYPVEDITWDIVPATMWNIVEAYITIICACLLATRPLFMKLIPDKLLARVQRSWTEYWHSLPSNSKIRLVTAFGWGRSQAQSSGRAEKPMVEENWLAESHSSNSGGRPSDVQKPPDAFLPPFSLQDLERHRTARERYEDGSNMP